MSAPAPGDKMRALYALPYCGLSSIAAIQLGMRLVDHANTKTGRCDPGTTVLLRETGLPERTLKRARAMLRETGIIACRQRGLDSMSYEINWGMLNRVYAQKFAKKAWTTDAKIGAKLKQIEADIAAGFEPNDDDIAFLEEVHNAYEAHNGDGLGGWAYRLLTGAA